MVTVVEMAHAAALAVDVVVDIKIVVVPVVAE